MKPQPPVDFSRVPVLTQAVELNPSLRPALLPWQVPDLVKEPLNLAAVDQNILADKVIEQVQEKIAELMPELLKESVDQVLRDHAIEQMKTNPTERVTPLLDKTVKD
jgi:hypothetical protein